MKLKGLLIGMGVAIAVFAALLLIFGVRFQAPMAAHGPALYNPRTEATVNGVVREIREFSCPVNDGELGYHFTMTTAKGVVQVHMVADRIMRSQEIKFAPGDRVEVIGSKFHFQGSDDLIARQIKRGDQTFIFRDHQGGVMMVQ
jgi:hypothetical protein